MAWKSVSSSQRTWERSRAAKSVSARRRAGVENRIPRETDESDRVYLDRVCDWLAERFVGYSIGQVSGRFRNGPLLPRDQAAEVEKEDRYLVDETTSVTRFIFPCAEDEVAAIRWFFNALFVESIINVVNGEDEIWMMESGLRNRLHIWKVDDSRSKGT